MQNSLLFAIFFFCIGRFLNAQDGVTVASTLLHATPDLDDTTAAIQLQAGIGLTVTGISSEVMVEDQEHRAFYWYHVEDKQGHTGWVPGYLLATMAAATDLPAHIRQFDTLTIAFHRDFGTTKLWYAAIQTRSEDPNDDASFKEYYLVLGNSTGKQLMYPIGIRNNQGNTETRQMFVTDVNADKYPDFIFLKRGNPAFGLPTWQLEIASVQHGKLVHIFERALTLTDSRGDISPMQTACIDIENSNIRIESVLLEACNDADDAFDVRSSTQEDCVVFETYSINWSATKQAFHSFYQPVRVSLSVSLATDHPSAKIHTAPDAKSSIIGYLQVTEKVKALKLFQQYQALINKKTRTTWVYIKRPDGSTGYVQGKCLKWLYTRHDAVLRQWCSGETLTVYEFEPKFDFLRVK
jgi:hypothetical protein